MQQQGMVSRVCQKGWWCAFVLILFLVLCPGSAHADGGAPNLAYVAGAGHGLSIIDIAQKRVTSTLNISGDPHTALLSLDGRFLYIAQPASGEVTVLAAKTGQVICSAHLAGNPSLLALDSSTSTLYAAGNGAAKVYALDPNTCALRRTLATSGSVYGLASTQLTTEGETQTQLWVTEPTSLAVFNQQGQLSTRIPVPAGPRFISLPGGNNAYVTTTRGTVLAVDFATYAVRLLLSGGDFGPMDFNENTSEVYVPDRLHNQIDVLTPVPAAPQPLPREPGHVISLSGSPQSVAITSDGQFGFVALYSGQVVMLDIPGRQVITTINVGGSPHFIITGLYPPLLGATPQQATILQTVGSIVAYLLLAALLLGPLAFWWRYNQKQQAAAQKEPVP
ncbi:MAG: YncE family protein [Ktedonobacteraceae bacterium]